ncbi:helix-turn-helix domain-containing protein [Nonomuraea sp. CA-143628]|uniref:helix-turn-helix domain-containing protein n=1 Tax=Nonomuraea sp. CA-143628 TaxID=3239997 RepID=UPI003D9159FD
MTVPRPDNHYARLLGATLRGHRVARGMSLRKLAAQIGLSGHGTLVDYEHGRRIPPEDLLTACEKVLDIADGHLLNLREKALAERAGHAAALLLDPPSEPVPESPEPPRRRRLILSGIVLLVALTVGAVVTFPLITGGAAATVRVGFERDTDDWVILYGPQVAQAEVTTSMAYEGRHSLLVTVAGASSSKGYSAVGTTHDLTGLRTGMKVTFHLWVPGRQSGGVRFFAYDSASKPHWAAETGETEIHLPSTAGWTAFTWTVPQVDRVHAIGMQIWSESDRPLIVAVDGVAW